MSKAKRATVTLYLTSKELYHLYNLLRDQIHDFDRSTREQIYSQLFNFIDSYCINWDNGRLTSGKDAILTA